MHSIETLPTWAQQLINRQQETIHHQQAEVEKWQEEACKARVDEMQARNEAEEQEVEKEKMEKRWKDAQQGIKDWRRFAQKQTASLAYKTQKMEEAQQTNDRVVGFWNHCRTEAIKAHRTIGRQAEEIADLRQCAQTVDEYVTAFLGEFNKPCPTCGTARPKPAIQVGQDGAPVCAH